MKIVYCVLELGEKKAPNAEEIARLTGAKAKDVAIKELRACTAGAEKVFAKLTDV